MTYSHSRLADDVIDIDLCNNEVAEFDELLRQHLALLRGDLPGLARRLGYPEDWVRLWLGGEYIPLASEQARLRDILEAASPAP